MRGGKGWLRPITVRTFRDSIDDEFRLARGSGL